MRKQPEKDFLRIMRKGGGDGRIGMIATPDIFFNINREVEKVVFSSLKKKVDKEMAAEDVIGMTSMLTMQMLLDYLHVKRMFKPKIYISRETADFMGTDVSDAPEN